MHFLRFSGLDIFYSYPYYGRGNGPVFVDWLQCIGTEDHLNNCTFSTPTACTHSNDVAVACKELTDGKCSAINAIRLTIETKYVHKAPVSILP